MMYKYISVLYCIFIYSVKILDANESRNTTDYDTSTWLIASKELEEKSDDLQETICDLLTSMGSSCTEEDTRDMRQYFINTNNVRKNSKLYELFALHFLNEGIVECVKESVGKILIRPLKGASNTVTCVFQPVIDLILISLKIILNSVNFIRNLHYQVKNCLTKRLLIGKTKCLMSLHVKTVKQIVNTMIELVIKVTRGVALLSGVGLARRFVTCSVKETVRGLTEVTLIGMRLGKCVLCVFTRTCS